jgi:hypothetical protein
MSVTKFIKMESENFLTFTDVFGTKHVMESFTAERLISVLKEDEIRSLRLAEKCYKGFANISNSLGENYIVDIDLCDVIKHFTIVELEKRRQFFDVLPNFFQIIDFSNRLWYHHATDRYYLDEGFRLLSL